ncbi:hypothetical protein CK503_15340 [Aliifodinibius salipaludis]|uniref:AMP-activated protein kinase glycogen-binding domain-containing protein n=1 Tax=Fodinibius salipaludis TaxID=2032627 RepID=A0A2A2G4N2_9BACT|nr:isoamylase early set domain-containing protein [Aliifodinibius salipaludis]PAU92736.1 hypothetical protein CK503_15340 [Aliifodinibius salipaludis]
MNKEEILQKYLDGELSGEEEREALHMIADDPEMREMLSFERSVRSTINETNVYDQPEVPDGFTDQVMYSIEQAEQPEPNISVIEEIKSWIQSLWRPKEIRLRPVYGVMATMILMIVILTPFYFDTSQEVPQRNNTQETIQQVTHSKDQVWVRFVYIDENAQSIELAGDFNGWEPVPLDKQEVNGEQVWTGLVSMSRGEHRYMFVKDGEKWVTDPMAPMQREDGFGNKNAVIYL